MSTNNNKAEIVQIFVKVTVKQGREENFEKSFQEAAEFSRKEEGNLSYQLFKIHDKPGEYVVAESYANGDALHEHMEKPYTKALFSSIENDLTHPISQHLSVTSELYPSI